MRSVSLVRHAPEGAWKVALTFNLLNRHADLARVEIGELDTEAKRKKLLDRYGEELIKRYPEWENLQVSLVAGAGFEPAAFRL
jgi:hypothetical protein